MMPRCLVAFVQPLRRGLTTTVVGSRASVSSPSQRHRLELFQSEQARQREFVEARPSKIHVHYKGLPENVTLLMNRGHSTPADCAAHIQEVLGRRSVVAMLDGKPWDMHRSIQVAEDKEECELELRHFKEANPQLANTVFWRSCAFLLGAVLESAFRPDHAVHLCSFPPPNLQTGSFVYDFRLVDADGAPVAWQPVSAELRLLSSIAQRMALDSLPFEPLEVTLGLAEEMFADNPMKRAQLPAIAASWQGEGNPRITVYRLGHHIDVSRGPMMNSSAQVGRFSVTAVHPIETSSYGPLLRCQGVALPPDFLSHFTTFEVLRRRAAKLNSSPLPELKAQPQT